MKYSYIDACDDGYGLDYYPLHKSYRQSIDCLCVEDYVVFVLLPSQIGMLVGTSYMKSSINVFYSISLQCTHSNMYIDFHSKSRTRQHLG